MATCVLMMTSQNKGVKLKMAYQNFYVEATNGHRQSPATCSGKQLEAELRVRNCGSSIQVIRVYAKEDKGKILNTHITITHPKTGEVLFDEILQSDK